MSLVKERLKEVETATHSVDKRVHEYSEDDSRASSLSLSDEETYLREREYREHDMYADDREYRERLKDRSSRYASRQNRSRDRLDYPPDRRRRSYGHDRR